MCDGYNIASEVWSLESGVHFESDMLSDELYKIYVPLVLYEWNGKTI